MSINASHRQLKSANNLNRQMAVLINPFITAEKMYKVSSSKTIILSGPCGIAVCADVSTSMQFGTDVDQIY